MKVISLLQPFASLVVTGAKKIETRSWNTKYRSEILIHASAKLSKKQIELGQEFNKKYGAGLGFVEDLQTGAIIGKVKIIATSILVPPYGLKNGGGDGIFFNDKSAFFTEAELAFGDYSAGRYGWLLSDPVEFKDHPIKIKGNRGLWNYHERICLSCGCTENDACWNADIGPCWWEGENLCSHCAIKIKGQTT